MPAKTNPRASGDQVVLVTGCAGFIGFHTAKRLLDLGWRVLGFDNLNPYYNDGLKPARLRLLAAQANFRFVEGDLADRQALASLLRGVPLHSVVHLAAQAGVRYSLENPHLYIGSNIVGFVNLAEELRRQKLVHFLFASSSSVYGESRKIPFDERDNVDHPISLYAATKKSDELIAHTYAHLYAMPITGLRLFTVYGPWGRPDMAVFKFCKAIE
jgi:UDP-glucuronate 4-epimerase